MRPWRTHCVAVLINVCMLFKRFFFSWEVEKVLQNNRWRLKRQIRAETIYIEMGFERRQRGDSQKRGENEEIMWFWVWIETRMKVPAKKIITYRMFVLIDTRSACIPFVSPLPQKYSWVAISSLPSLFFSICCRGFKGGGKVFCKCGGVFISLSLVGLLKQTVSRDLWGSQHSETLIWCCHHSLR